MASVGKGIVLPLTLNPREFIAGIKVAERGVEQFEDALEGLEDAGDDAAEALEDGFKDAIRDTVRRAEDLEGALDEVGAEADSAAGKVESEFKSAVKDAGSAFDRFGRAARDDMKRVEGAADGVTREMDDIESEANQSAKEFGASFRGDPVEALEEVQSLGAEIALKTLPGIAGAAVAIGGGIVFGFIISQFEKLREAAEELRENVAELRDEYLELSDVDFANIGQLNTFERFIEQLDEAGVSLEDFQGIVDETSPKAQELYDAFQETGSTEDLLAFLGQLRTDINLTGDEYDGASKKALGALGPLRKTLQGAADDADYARENFSDAALGIDETSESAQTLEETADAAAQAVRGLGDEFATADERVDDYRGTVIDATEAVEELTEDGAKPLKKGLDTTTKAGLEAKDTLRDLAGSALDAAAAQVELDGDTKNATATTREARRKFIEMAIQLGLTEQQAKDYADELGLIPKNVKTSIKVDDADARRRIQNVQTALDNLKDKTVTVTVTELTGKDNAAASRAQTGQQP